MNLSLPGLDVSRVVREDHDAGQWFTPMAIARRMVAWAGSLQPDSILEPSCGSGNIVAACRERWATATIEAIELDEHYAQDTRNRFSGDANRTIFSGSFLEHPLLAERYDLCVMNPPYEDGLDGRFLAKAMDLSDRVIALIRLQALAGQSRHEGVWSRCKPEGDFALRGLAIFARRPRFEAGRAVGDREDGGSAKADFCVVKLSRRTDEERTKDIGTHIEWWMP